MVRGPWKDAFAPLWQKYTIVTSQRQSAVAQLRRENTKFGDSCQSFIYDLRTYGSKGSRARLDETGHEFFLGQPYFEPLIVEAILGLPTIQGSVSDQLQSLKEKLSDGEMCAAHHLAPIYEAALGFSWNKDLKETINRQHTMKEATISTKGTMIKKLMHKPSKFLATVGRKKGRGMGGGKGQGGAGRSSEAST